MIGALHTDGRYIKDVNGRRAVLRGCDFLEPSYNSDHLRNGDPLIKRARRFKALGVNLVRLEVNYEKFESNEDTNGDGIGNKDFTLQAIETLANEGLFVIPGLHTRAPPSFYTSPALWADWLVRSLLEPFDDTPNVVGVYIFNEPKGHLWGGTDLGGGVTTGYWSAVKEVCRQIDIMQPGRLMIVHADMANSRGFCPILRTDPIPTPNVVYTYHYYYVYCPAFNAYIPWGSTTPDPTYQECKNRGQPFYQSYAAGNYSQARNELEQMLYDRFLWPAVELDLPIICDEFGFNGNEFPYFSTRTCPTGDWTGNLKDCLDSNGSPVTPPYTGTVYCPVDMEPIIQPQPYGEPGWSQCFKDYLQILNGYDVPWAYFAWWVKVYGGYGLVNDDMTTLSKVGNVWKNYLPKPFISSMFSWKVAPVGLVSFLGYLFFKGKRRNRRG